MTKKKPSCPFLDTHFYLKAEAFFEKTAPLALTYDDVSLATNYSDVLPKDTRVDVQLSESLHLHIPLLSADMDTVTESSMAIAMALNGGLGLIHCNMTHTEQTKHVSRVKRHVHGLIEEPITVSPEDYIGDVLHLIENKSYNFRSFPVVDAKNKLLGLLTGKMVKERYKGLRVIDAMVPRKKVYTLSKKEISHKPIEVADAFFNKQIGISKLLVVDGQDHLCGFFTASDIERITLEARSNIKPARDKDFRLVCAASIMPLKTAQGNLDKKGITEHVSNLVELGLDAIAVSTAHGHSLGVGQTVQLIRKAFKDLTIIAGNVTSQAGVEYLADCGANVIKVGQGPGSICTTRIVAGVGTPQLTALYLASKGAKAKGVKLLADGGITKSGDIVKALSLADGVICGGLLAGCREAPGQIIEIDGKLYKQYRGMGSQAAMAAGSAVRYGYDKRKSLQKRTAEGVEALKEISGPVDKTLNNLVGGLQAGMGYIGAHTLQELKTKAYYMQVSPAGQKESGTHDIIEIKASKIQS